MNRRTSIILLVTAFACACLYQGTEANRPLKNMLKNHHGSSDKVDQTSEGSERWMPFEMYTGPKYTPKERAAGEQAFLWNPLKFILRIISIITFPPRFIVRFFYTFAATFFLVLFNCQVIPEVQCAVPVSQMIPGIIDGLREELEFYASLGKHD